MDLKTDLKNQDKASNTNENTDSIHPAWKKRFLNLSRSLTVQIMAAILIAVIPINIIAVYVTSIVQRDASQTVYQMYQNEVDLFEEMTNQDGQRILTEFVNFRTTLVEDINPLDDSDINKQVKELNLFSDIKDLQAVYSQIHAAFLLNHKRDVCHLYVNKDVFDYEADVRIRQELESFEMDKASGFYLTTMGGQIVFLQAIRVYDYIYGFIVSPKALVERLAEDLSDKEFQMLLIDEAENLAYSYNEDCILHDLPELDKQGKTDFLENDILFRKNIKLQLYISASAIRGDAPNGYWLLFLLDIICILLIPGLLYYIYRGILQPIGEVEDAMFHIEKDDLEYRINAEAGSNEFSYLYRSYNRMADSLKDLTIEAYELELQKTRMDALNARLQVNPHMLLNSFNMINSLALAGNTQLIRDYTRNLVKYFRYVLRKDQDLVTLQDELDFIIDYLEVQKIRFPGRFTFLFDTSEEVDERFSEIYIPPFILENFVENCIKYALRPDQTVEIFMSFRLEDEVLMVSIVDDGNGMTQELTDKINNGEVVTDNLGTHIGVWNTRKRIGLYYGERARLQFTSTPGEGTQVWMELPLKDLKVKEVKEKD